MTSNSNCNKSNDKSINNMNEETEIQKINILDDYLNIDNRELIDVFNSINQKINSLNLIMSSPQFKTNIENIKNNIEQLNQNINLKINQFQEKIDLKLKIYKKNIRKKCTDTLINYIKENKGEKFCKEFIICSLSDFEKYYNYIVPLKIKELEKVNSEESFQNLFFYYMKENFKKENDNFNLLINLYNKINLNTKYKKEKIKLKIGGEIKQISEDEIIIDFADVIPYLNEKKVFELKCKFKIISKLILQVLLRQFPFLNQIDIFCSIYYAKKAKNYFNHAFTNENMEFEDNITFIYINII